MIQAKNLTKSYWNKHTREEIVIFENLSFSIPENRVTVITGDSGTGKTTLLKIISLRDHQFSGDVTLKNISADENKNSKLLSKHLLNNRITLNTLTQHPAARLRRGCVGFVYQDYNLIPELTILENVMLPLKLQSVRATEVKEEAKRSLEEVGLGDDLEGDSGFHQKYPPQLSGGQQQRVGIARAMVHKPKLLFADEPTGNLDDNLASEVMNLMSSYREKNNATLIIVTHDETLKPYADTLLHLSKPKHGKPAILS